MRQAQATPKQAAPAARRPAAGPLRAPGSPLAGAVRADAERLLGHDFSSVRIHAGADAAEAAQGAGAVAYALGEHLVFGADRFAPETPAGRRVLVHELAHVAQQRGGTHTATGAAPHASAATAEREADAAARAAGTGAAPLTLSARPVGIHRIPLPRSGPTLGGPATTPAPAATPRQRFEQWLQRRFPGVRIVDGTQARQTSEVFSRRTGPATPIPPALRILPNWQPWDERAAGDLYDHAIEAIQDVAGVFGGSPNITEVVLYATEYELTATGAVPRPGVGASFGAGQLTIYGSSTHATKWLPVARSTTRGRYPSVVMGVGGVTGQSPGAPIPYPTRSESERRIIAHELGHGIAEAAAAVDPQVFVAWGREVGWFQGSLFDVQAPGVRAALQAGTAPPAAALITQADWNSPAHGEQPLTDYAVTGGPGEDFAESVMALVYEPELLRTRSPARYAFLQARRGNLLPQLVPLPPVGDFPTPSRGDTRVA